MKILRASCAALLFLLLLLLAVPASLEAQPGDGPRLRARKGLAAKKGKALPRQRIEALDRLTPEQQERFLESLPAPRRAEARRQLGTWREMSPDERARARQTLGEFRELSPERQRKIRGLFARFNQAPADRQPILRAELQELRRLDPADSRARINSDEFRNKYTPAEQQLLADLSDALPQQDDDDRD